MTLGGELQALGMREVRERIRAVELGEAKIEVAPNLPPPASKAQGL